jgi:hypothetical protein
VTSVDREKDVETEAVGVPATGAAGAAGAAGDGGGTAWRRTV